MSTEEKISDIFRRMADRIDKNSDSAFGGAVVVIPPGGHAPIELLVLDPSSDLSRFYKMLNEAIKEQLVAMEASERQKQGFGVVR